LAAIQLIQCKNQQKTSSRRRNIVFCKEIWVKEANDDVKILTVSSQIAVSVHAHWKYG